MKNWFTKLFLFICALSYAQNINLVPNSSFEVLTSCPNNYNQVGLAYPWVNPTTANPDLLNTCNSSFLNVPNYGNLFQNSHTGFGHAFIFTYSIGAPATMWREYIQVQLNDTLVAGTEYLIFFYVNLANTYYKKATNNIGAYLSSNAISLTNANNLPFIPQILNSPIVPLTDTMNWQLISNCYQSNGTEQYLTIGNFFDDANTIFTSIDSTFPASGYFIDDVNVIDINCMKPQSNNDTSICAGESITIKDYSTIYPLTNYYLYENGILIDSSTSSVFNLTPLLTGVYVLEKKVCGIYFKDTITVTVKPRFTADVISSTVYLCINDSLKLNAINTVGSTQWSWLPNSNIINPNTQQPIVFPTQNTQYTVTANFANSSNYCNNTFTDTIQVIVLSDDTCSEEINFIVPNVFSPNGDNINETFSILNYSGDIEEYSCMIFNRWGNLIFETKKTARFWDGHTTAGMPCEPGTYYYVIKAKNKVSEKEYKGFVELLH